MNQVFLTIKLVRMESCVCVCVRACVHACVRACVRACVCVCVFCFVSLFSVFFFFSRLAIKETWLMLFVEILFYIWPLCSKQAICIIPLNRDTPFARKRSFCEFSRREYNLILNKQRSYTWWLLLYSAILRSRADSLHCTGLLFIARFWISTEVVYLQPWHGWCHMKLLPSRRKFCAHNTTMHHATSCKAT